jgi:pyruvate/2-oxoglutarate dehydrogenase complex dihydrolipoamide acyltransferase (E2) component
VAAATTIIMPMLGESVTEGIVERWLKGEGEVIQQDEPLVEVSTDKVTAEIPSPTAGTLAKILVQPGQTVPVNSPIALVETDVPGDEGMRGAGEQSETVDEERRGLAPAATSPSVPTSGDPHSPHPAIYGLAPLAGAPHLPNSREDAARRRSTPLVRRLAAQYGVALSAIQGTGFGGRVRREDLQAHLEVVSSAPSPSPHPRNAASAANLVPLTAVRRIIAERLTQSRQQVPDATAVFEVDMTGIVRRRAAVREEFRSRTGVDLTYLPFAVKAVTAALRAYPAINVSFTIDGILAHRDIHIGIPVAVDGGREPGSDVLVVPVLRAADGLSLAGIARAIHDLALRARAGALNPDDLSGATFTVNNTGAVGTIISTPIIPQPQAAIMTTEAIVKRPMVLTDAEGHDSIAIRSMMFACLTFDHRAFDGLTAGRFMGQVKRWLETVGPACDLY